MIEGTVTSLLEKDGSIVGVAYRSKNSDSLEVTSKADKYTNIHTYIYNVRVYM